MSTILDQVSTLVSANLHDVLNRALQANSPAVLDEYIRQAEDNISHLEDAAATVGGEVKGIQRHLLEQQARQGELDRSIDALLKAGKEGLALAVQSQLNATAKLVDTYQQQFNTQNTEYQHLLDAKVKLEAKLASMKQEREQLVALLELAKSKETVVKATRNLDDLMGSGDVDVARIAEGINTRLDKANTASEMRTNSLQDQIDQALGAGALNSQLLERKQKLGLVPPVDSPKDTGAAAAAAATYMVTVAQQ